MAMSFTAISTDDVGVLDSTFGITLKASGAILAGEALCISGASETCRVNAQDCGVNRVTGFVGVAEYSASHGDYVSVIGPGNMVRSRVSGSVVAGQPLKAVPLGFFKGINSPVTSGSYQAQENYQAIAMEDIANDAAGKILLV